MLVGVYGSTHTYVHYIVAGGAPVAIYENNTASVQKTRYLHRDHLGSVTHLTNESGTVAETLSYDPWGKRRNATTWANAGSQIFATETPRGYTGHEHLDDVSLVHMNGRAYDPDTGRMLSADPYVQAPGYTQSFNRFSYVFNNPLRYTDPSGHCTVAGASCPTSGFGGFVGGYAAARTGAPPRLGLPRATIQMRRVPVTSLGWFGFIGGPSSAGNVYGGGCTNTRCSFDDVPGSGGGFGWGMTWTTSWVLHTTIRWSAPLYLPNNEQGNTQTIIGHFEQNWGGPSSSPMVEAPGNRSGWSAFGWSAYYATMPGAANWAYAESHWQQGNYFWAAAHSVSAVAEAALTVVSLGAYQGLASTGRASISATASVVSSVADDAARGTAQATEAFHYTFSKYLASISKNGLRQGTYATRSGTLSPLQAQIELALPANRGLPNALVRIDLAGMRQAGYEIPELTRVSGRFGLPGGGYEMQFPYPIPPQFISVVP